MARSHSRPTWKLQKSTLVWCIVVLLTLYAITTFRSLSAIQESHANTIVSSPSSALQRLPKRPQSGRKDENGFMLTVNSENQNPILESLSSVDYFACCGLGHRLIRLSLAHYIAKLKGMTLRTFWGWCGEQDPIEVFSYLFEPYREEDVLNVLSSTSSTSRGRILPFYNEVPGFTALARSPTNGNLTACRCHEDKIQADVELYSSLRRRFRNKAVVDAFVQKHFSNGSSTGLVLGIHVRAGNGEGGDFARKGRQIDNPEEWVKSVCKLIETFVQEHQNSQQFSVGRAQQAVLYIATDTPSMVGMFRKFLVPAKIPVLDLPQQGRPQEGDGVLFGESNKVHNKDRAGENTIDADRATIDDYSACLQGWTDTLTDMFLLSHADVVIAGNPSSFSQTLPMSLAFGGQEGRRVVDTPYCEVIPNFEEVRINASATIRRERSPTLQCYKSYLDWCCNFETWIRFHQVGPKGRHKIHSKEFVKFLLPDKLDEFARREFPAMRNRTADCKRPRRGRVGGGLKDKCLPHQW